MNEGENLSIHICANTLDEKRQMARVPYSSVIGSFIYPIMCTRPDLCQATRIFNRFQSNPRNAQEKLSSWSLKLIKTLVLWYHGEDMQLKGYMSAD